MSAPQTMGDLMDAYEAELLTKTRAEIAREDADPEHQARIRERIAAREAQIERDIAAGLRDENGEWINTNTDDDDEEGDFWDEWSGDEEEEDEL